MWFNQESSIKLFSLLENHVKTQREAKVLATGQCCKYNIAYLSILCYSLIRFLKDVRQKSQFLGELVKRTLLELKHWDAQLTDWWCPLCFQHARAHRQTPSITIVAAVSSYATPMVARQQNKKWRQKEGNWEEQSLSCLQWNSMSCFQQGSRFIQTYLASFSV